MKLDIRNYLGQSAARIFALAIPFALTLAARALFPEAQSIAFFRLLADAVLVTAFAKLGVDVYIARCETNQGRIVVSSGYMLLFHLLSVLTMVAFLIWGTTQGGIFQTLGISALVVQASLLAEIARTRGWYTAFYLLKAPMIYVAVAIWVFAYLAHPVLTSSAAVFALAGMIALNLHFTQFDLSAGVGWTKLFPATALSVLIVVFSWKEVLLIDQYANDHSLEIATFYTRFKLVITFFFVLHSARVPNLMREAGPDFSQAQIRKIMRGPRLLIWGTASIFILVGFVFAGFVDSTEFLPAALMLSSCPIFIAFGNLIPVLNAMDRQVALISAYVQAIAVFLLVTLAMLPFSTLLTGVSIAAMVAQTTLGLHMWITFQRIVDRKAVQVSKWN